MCRLRSAAARCRVGGSTVRSRSRRAARSRERSARFDGSGASSGSIGSRSREGPVRSVMPRSLPALPTRRPELASSRPVLAQGPPSADLVPAPRSLCSPVLGGGGAARGGYGYPTRAQEARALVDTR